MTKRIPRIKPLTTEERKQGNTKVIYVDLMQDGKVIERHQAKHWDSSQRMAYKLLRADKEKMYYARCHDRDDASNVWFYTHERMAKKEKKYKGEDQVGA